MAKFKRFISIFLIRSLLLSAVFGFAPVHSYANEQEIYSQSYLKQIGAESAMGNFSAQAITVAVIDEGVDFTHPLLWNLQWTNIYEQPDGIDNDRNGLTDDVFGWNFLNNSNSTLPQGGHGTKLSGIIKTIAQNSGTNIKIMPLIVCEQQSGCNIDAVGRAIRYAADNGAKIINLSLGTGNYDSSLDQPIAYAFQKGVVVVAAAGQDGAGRGFGANLDTKPISPVCNDQGQNMVLGVSSTLSTGSPAAWANFGSCVDVLAPAENIYTSFSPSFSNGQTFGSGEGSSYAAAEVSAIAAVLLSLKPQATNTQIYSAIISGSQKTNFFPAGYGTGVVNLQKSLNNLNTTTQSAATIPQNKNKVLGAKTVKIKVFEKKPITPKKPIKPRG